MKKIIVAGAGLGGLVSAGLLAKRGYKVTVLERSPLLGGRSHVFSRDGFTLPYGAHAILGPKAEPLKSIFNELDIHLSYNKLSLTKFKLFSDRKGISSTLSIGALMSPEINGFFNHFGFIGKYLRMIKAKPNFDKVFSVQEWINQILKILL